jgi:hypothetical protein
VVEMAVNQAGLPLLPEQPIQAAVAEAVNMALVAVQAVQAL